MFFSNATLLALILYLIIQFEFKTISVEQYYHPCQNCEVNFAINVINERLIYRSRQIYNR